MKKFFYETYYKLPRVFQHFISRIVYRPKISKTATLYGWPVFSENVSIGSYSYMKQNTFMRNVSIGKFCCIADNLVVGLNEHPFSDFSSYRFSGIASPVRKYVQEPKEKETNTFIGNDVWIGQDVLIKGGVTIGNGAVIGARSVVTKNVPPYAVVAGVPARVIKYRFDKEKIDYLQRLQWWDWDLQRIVKLLDKLHAFDPSLLEEQL